MAKRFHDTEIWDEDWFIALPRDYRDLWLWVKDKCDHAGIYKPNIATFNKLNDCNVEAKKAIEFFNKDRTNGDRRVIVLPNGRWLLVGFIPFQYGNTLNLANPMHKSIYKLLQENNVDLTSIKPLIEVSETSRRPHGIRVKDKDKDKDIVFKGGMGERFPHLQNKIFKDAWNAYLLMRRQIRKPATERAQELVLKDLQSCPVNTAIEMLEQSIKNSWQGVFPLKNPKPTEIKKAQNDCPKCKGVGWIYDAEGRFRGKCSCRE